MYANVGRYGFIDLNENKAERLTLPETFYQKFIGGMGATLKLFEIYSKGGIDALSPDNTVVIGSGPLVGTLAPSSSKTFVTTKFPLNRCIGTSVGGMYFAKMMKNAGFDNVVIQGSSKKPVYIYICNETIEIRDANDLWGLDLYETTEVLKSRLGIDHSVIAIGQAGENLVHISLALIDKIASLGKGGLGAVLGSKKIKAIVAFGENSVRISNPQDFMAIVGRIYSSMKSYANRDRYMKLGSMGGWTHWCEVAGIPYKNWKQIYPHDKLRSKCGPEIYLKDVKKRNIACPTCSLPCKESFTFQGEDGEICTTYASSFIGRVTAFGARCDVDDIQKVLICHDICSRLGLDTYSASAMVDFVISLVEDGQVENWDKSENALKRDFNTTKDLLHKIAFRQGIGAALADGFDNLEEQLGTKFESQIKGADFIFDGRAYRMGTYEFEQVVNPRGGHQHAGGSPTYGSREVPIDDLKAFCVAMAVPEASMREIFAIEGGFNVARLTKHCEEYYAAFSMLGICSRKIIKPFFSMDTLARLYSTATGFDMEAKSLKEAAERVWNLLKLLNVCEGFTRDKDLFPVSWLKPLKDGKKAIPLMDYYGRKVLNEQDLNRLLDDYYSEHGWCREHGIPEKRKVMKLGLNEEARRLKSRNLNFNDGPCHI